MSKSSFEDLIEISWRRALTQEEEAALQAWLAAHPEDTERWEFEAGLNLALERVPAVQPSSNFTSRVLALVEQDQRAAQRSRSGWLNWFGGEWLTLRRLSWASVCMIAFAVAVNESGKYGQKQVSRGLKSISAVAAVTPSELVEDFDVVVKFNAVRAEQNPTDEALYVLLAK